MRYLGVIANQSTQQLKAISPGRAEAKLVTIAKYAPAGSLGELQMYSN